MWTQCCLLRFAHAENQSLTLTFFHSLTTLSHRHQHNNNNLTCCSDHASCHSALFIRQSLSSSTHVQLYFSRKHWLGHRSAQNISAFFFQSKKKNMHVCTQLIEEGHSMYRSSLATRQDVIYKLDTIMHSTVLPPSQIISYFSFSK